MKMLDFGYYKMTYGEIITKFERQFPGFNYIDCRPYCPVDHSLIFYNDGGQIAVTYKGGKFELIPNHSKYLSEEFYKLTEKARDENA